MTSENYDILSTLPQAEINVLDKGFVKIIDCMPRSVPQGLTCDYRIAQAARVSYGNGTKSINEDTGLIRYLMRHKHTTPFEKVVFEFHIKLPLFVFAQLVRHRTASINSLSARYSVMKDEFYLPKPEQVRGQSSTNKQGSSDQPDKEVEWFAQFLEDYCEDSYLNYEKALSDGVTREQARMILPQNLYTEIYWTINLHNLLHFLDLRLDNHAQYEIRVYAEAIYSIVQKLCPVTVTAFDDYSPMRGGMTLTRLELDSLRDGLKNTYDVVSESWFPKLATDNKREQLEWNDKLGRILGVL